MVIQHNPMCLYLVAIQGFIRPYSFLNEQKPSCMNTDPYSFATGHCLIIVFPCFPIVFYTKTLKSVQNLLEMGVNLSIKWTDFKHHPI